MKWNHCQHSQPHQRKPRVLNQLLARDLQTIYLEKWVSWSVMFFKIKITAYRKSLHMLSYSTPGYKVENKANRFDPLLWKTTINQ